MKFILLALFGLFAMATTIAAQRITVSSICSPGTSQPEDVVLTICTHERGMTSWLQPKLYLRLFADGRAEYEVDPPLENRAGQTNFVMVAKPFTADADALAAIQELGRQPDFQSAPAMLPYYQAGMDVSIETTITFYADGKAKPVKLVNASMREQRNKKSLPPSVLQIKDKADLIRELAVGYKRPAAK